MWCWVRSSSWIWFWSDRNFRERIESRGGEQSGGEGRGIRGGPTLTDILTLPNPLLQTHSYNTFKSRRTTCVILDSYTLVVGHWLTHVWVTE